MKGKKKINPELKPCRRCGEIRFRTVSKRAYFYQCRICGKLRFSLGKVE